MLGTGGNVVEYPSRKLKFWLFVVLKFLQNFQLPILPTLPMPYSKAVIAIVITTKILFFHFVFPPRLSFPL